jgi:hypothetical protein
VPGTWMQTTRSCCESPMEINCGSDAQQAGSCDWQVGRRVGATQLPRRARQGCQIASKLVSQLASLWGGRGRLPQDAPAPRRQVWQTAAARTPAKTRGMVGARR